LRGIFFIYKFFLDFFEIPRRHAPCSISYESTDLTDSKARTMKQRHSTTKRTSEPVADLYQDETMAMVYVGDVYSLVAQQGATGEEAPSTTAEPKAEKLDESNEDNDALRPYVR
jgi:hypothetical protein